MKTSEQVDQISQALSMAQGEFKPIEKNKLNPHFKSPYADLSSVIEATKISLAVNSLAISQSPCYQEGRVNIVTRLFHKTGQWIETTISIKPAADTAQAIGSAITYGRRYALCAILGVCADDDDDGNEASKPAAVRPTAFKPAAAPPVQKQQQSPIQDRIKSMVPAFSRFQINSEEIERFIGKPYASFIESDINSLINVYGKLSDNKMCKDDFLAHSAKGL